MRIPYSKAELLRRGGPRKFSGRALDQVAFPLGGVGAGSISLGGRGELKDWEVFNRPGKGNRPAYTFFLLWARPEGGRARTKVLEAHPPPPYTGSHGYPREHGGGLPHLAGATFEGAFPFARISFRDPDVPLRVSLEAFSPFIPLNPEDSALPVAVLTYRLANRVKVPVEVSLVGSLMNFVGYPGDEPRGRLWGIGAPYYGGNLNSLRHDDGISGIFMTTTKYPPESVQFGSLTLAVLGSWDLTYQTHWSREGWFDELQRFWDRFSSEGRLEDDASEDPSPEGRTDVGSVGVRVLLEPGGRVEVPFLVAWHFPNFVNYWNPETRGTSLHPFYSSRFKDAWEVAQYVARNYGRLLGETRSFQRALFSSTLPDHVLDAISSQASILRTNTLQWYSDGTVHAFEGCNDRSGCCHGTCTHVWNYEQTLAFLFPQLERDMRVTDFLDTDEDGHMNFRHVMPRGVARVRGKPAADGQMGTVMKLYREWRLSGDMDFLRRLWPKAKKALEFAWKEWDRDRDGVMEGVQHNTYDVEFIGPNPMTGLLYLGALRAGEEMARALGDREAARKFREVYEGGREKLDRTLWDGEYYIQKYDGAPKYQFGSGCLSDQMLGQWWAHILDLGYLLPEDRVRKAVSSIFKYNWRTDFYDHANCQRIYALGDERGLLLCSWPKGGRPQFPFPYSDEVWTGIEYEVAALLVWEGFLEEGLAVVKGARDRYDGERRNPYDEVECGHHYARALSSWSLLLALSGFHYSAPERGMGFFPKVFPEDFRCFWSTGSGWGTFRMRVRRRRLRAELSVLYGELELEKLELGPVEGKVRDLYLRAGRRPVQVEVLRKGGKLCLSFPGPTLLKAGKVLRVYATV